MVLLALGGFTLQHLRQTAERRLSDGNRPSTNPEANAYYERSLLFGGGAQADVQQMRRMLERALAIDAKFAAARAEYAFSNVGMIFEGASNDPSSLYKAEQEIRQALQDDPGCGRAHSVLAVIYLLQGRKELLPGEVDKALKANPDDVTAHGWLLLYHFFNGDEAQAFRMAKQMITRWPLFWPARLNLGEFTPGTRRYSRRNPRTRQRLEQDPQNVQLLSPLASVYIDSGDLLKARQVLERARTEHRQSYLLRQDWLDRAVRMGDDREDWLCRDPLLASIRQHPRFQQILASVAYRGQQRSRSSAGFPIH